MELNILRADPAGNITVFVLDPVEKTQRAAIAEKIMAIPALKAEQVGYACVAEDDVDGHMEMMGGEFCGTRHAPTVCTSPDRSADFPPLSCA